MACVDPSSSAELFQFFEQFSGALGYLVPFAVLLLCGIGLPLPEEVTLIGSGLLLYQGHVEFVPITAVCMSAILLGDSIPFWLGRKYGLRALRLRWVAKILHPERFQKLEAKFAKHGNFATFGFRFFAGVRLPGYFLSGMMGMPYGRFLLLDFLGALLSVPISIYLGKLFGGQIDRLQETVHGLHLILALAVVALVLILVLRARWTRADRALAAARASIVPAAPVTPAAPAVTTPAPVDEAADRADRERLRA